MASPSESTETPEPNIKTGAQPESPARPAADPATITTPIEALLLTSDRPMAAAKLAEVIASAGLADGADARAVDAAVELLNEAYERSGRAFRIEATAGGYRVMTLPEHAGLLAAFHRSRSEGRLSRPAIETLAIVAYQQPVTRARLEAIRGVACGEVLRSLLERRLISVVGRAEELGRPMLYGTTRRFLEVFGIVSVKDLPKPEDLAAVELDA
ncbi:MAG: SMC-Scp complex subunit ScpB [Planctomycetota bacterium]